MMKALKLFVFATVLLAAANTVLYAQTPTPTPTPGFVYMSNYPREGSEGDDTARIRRAIAVPSGTIVFDENIIYDVRETIDLHSYLTLTGSTGNTLLGYPNSPSHIRFTPNATNKALFRMAASLFSISFRDLGLSTTSSDGTIGVEARGEPNRSIQFVEFRNVQFDGFHYGIAAVDPAGPTNWQFDNVKVEHSHFIVPKTGEPGAGWPNIADRHAAIYVDSANSGWRIYSTNLSVGPRSMGLYFNRVHYTDIDSMITQGPLPEHSPGPVEEGIQAHSAIYVKDHGSLKISNSVSEEVYYDLRVVPDAPVAYPINLISNTFQNRVEITGSTVNSIGNQFGLEQPWPTNPDGSGYYSSPLPIAGANSVVYSMGDKFCMGALIALCDRKWETSSNGVRHLTFGLFKSDFEAPLRILNFSESTFPIDYTNQETTERPMFSIMSPTVTSRNLLRLGNLHETTAYHYTISRDQNNGYLKFVGNQDSPYRGYDFNGPVKLPEFTVSTLPTPQGSGALLYCSDCAANNSTCTGSGGGALAMSIGSNWVCK